MDLELHDGFAVVRPRGHRLIGDAIVEVAQAIEAVCERKLPALLVDATGLQGFGSPSLADRAAFARQWATAANGRLRLAVLAAREFIDEERFAVVIAANYGLTVSVFDNEAEALDWLRSGH